jgi:GNAT superfamily N-acetyltransferase
LGTSTPPASVIIRPAELDDVEPILEMHERLSSDTLYNRYHANRLPSQSEIEHIVQLNGQNGRSFVAAIPGKRPKIVGLALYIITEQGTAETAFLVEDLYQGQGIGRRLMQALSQAATKEDICILNARVLRSNRPMMHLLYTSGQLIDKKSDYGALELQVDICSLSE